MSTLSNVTGILSCMIAGAVIGLALNQLLVAHFMAALIFGGIGAVFVAVAKVMFDQYERFLNHVGK